MVAGQYLDGHNLDGHNLDGHNLDGPFYSLPGTTSTCSLLTLSLCYVICAIGNVRKTAALVEPLVRII